MAHGDGLVGAAACSTPRAVVDVLGQDEAWPSLRLSGTLAFCAPLQSLSGGHRRATTCREEFGVEFGVCGV